MPTSRDELVDFIECSMQEHGIENNEALVQVIADCLDHVHKSIKKPMVSVTYKVAELETTYSATSVPLLLELIREVKKQENEEYDLG